MNGPRSRLAAAAALGLLSAGCPAGEKPKDEKPAMPSSAAPAGDKDCCMGKNACKGKGGCAVPENHSCAGKNDCAGKGGCNMHCAK